MLAPALLCVLIGLSSWMPLSVARRANVNWPPPASEGESLRGGVTIFTCTPVVNDAGHTAFCRSDPQPPISVNHSRRVPQLISLQNPDPVECRVSLHTNTVALPNRCHEVPGTPGLASCEATIPTFLLFMAQCEVAFATSLDRQEKCDQDCDQYTGSDNCVLNEKCAVCFIDFHRFFPSTELEKGLCIRTPVAQVPAGRDLINLTDTPVENNGEPLSTVPMRMPLPVSEWGNLIGGTTYVICIPAVNDEKIYCQSSFPYLPNESRDWTRRPNPDQVECRVSLHTSTVSLPNDCQEMPGTSGFISCGAEIPETLLTIARCEITGVTDVVPGSVEFDRHERCDRECDQYTSSDTCVFSEECAVCFINFHLLFPGVELEKGLCKMTPVPQVPRGRYLMNVTCTPVEVGGVIRCHSKDNPYSYSDVFVRMPIFEPVQCNVSVAGLALPNECQEVPGRPMLTYCTVTIPRSLLTSTECYMIGDTEMDGWQHHQFISPARQNCNRMCEQPTAWETCVVNEECRLCVQDFRAFFPGEELNREVCENYLD